MKAKELNIITDPRVDVVYANYPSIVKDKMQALRELVLETAATTAGIIQLEETLKWGEPSFITKQGILLSWCMAILFHLKAIVPSYFLSIKPFPKMR